MRTRRVLLVIAACLVVVALFGPARPAHAQAPIALTGQVTTGADGALYKVPELKPGFPNGARSVRFDRDSNLWLGMMFQGGIATFDRKTGTFAEYTLPRQTNIRRVFVDNSTSPPTFWVGHNHGASVIKLEPLD